MGNTLDFAHSDEDQFSPRLIYDPDVSKRYLSLDELGRVLKFLSESSSKGNINVFMFLVFMSLKIYVYRHFSEPKKI